MFFHQLLNSVGDNVYNCYIYRSFQCATHIHKGMEWTIVLRGELRAQVDDKNYVLRAGDSLFVAPYQLHAYEKSDDMLCVIVVFSGAYVESFARLIGNLRPLTATFSLSEREQAHFLSQIGCETLLKNPISEHATAVPCSDPLSLKSALYGVCAAFYAQAQWTAETSKKRSLVLDCLFYIDEHYLSDISLTDAAKALGYDYDYLSRSIHRMLGVGFKTLLHQYRCEHAQYLIVATQLSMAEIAMNSGFQSIRSFNRIFKEITGISPTQLRK